jgi:transcription elongation GreA/GreB family factor
MRADDDTLVVRVGSRVRLRGTASEDDEVVIVESPSNMGRFRLSTATPLGHALLGHRAGDVVIVHIEEGPARTFTILGIDE